MAVSLPTALTKERTKTPVPEQVDVAIVGAGLGGLTAGAYLARHGLSVVLCDQHYVAGGCATQFHRGGDDDRYIFDIGIHYVGDCGPDGNIPTVLRQCGVEQEFVPLDPDGFDILRYPDFEFRIPADEGLYRDRLVQMFPEERRGIDKYFAFIRATRVAVRATQPKDFEVDPAALWTILTRAPSVIPLRGVTLGKLLDKWVRDPKLKAVLAGQHGDYGLPPGEVAALFHAGVVVHFLQGGYYPRGGGQAMSDKLAASIEAAGGSICLRTGIDRILVEGGRAVGVRTEERKDGVHEIRAKVVLSNADPRATWFDLVGAEHLPPKLVKRAGGFVDPAALFLLCLGVDDDLAARGMKAANYWTVDGYDLDGLYAESRQDERQMPRGAYITSATLKDPGMPGHAPPGLHNLEVMTLVRGEPERWGVERGVIEKWKYRKNEDYQERKQAVEDDLLRRLEAEFPGVTEHIVFKESASPISHIRFTRSGSGTGYGLAVTTDQFEGRRIHPRGPIPGLYHCGASGRHHLGVMGTMLSGRDAARRIAEDLGKPLGL